MDSRSEVRNSKAAKHKKRAPAAEIAVIGEVDDWEEDVVRALLDIPPGGNCVFYIDSTGGSVYGALAVLTLMRHRKLKGTAVVLGECSSAALLLFAGCQRRLVTAHSTFLFHKMRWQSDKRVDAGEAVRWARHFEELEREIDDLQVRLFGAAEEKVRAWTVNGDFVTGPELVAVSLAEMLPL
ncbi:MAG TPA: ATP-dependent Clp protease proteolytic subunit [Gemmataceae bacterium]|nr:ATP-dependent Clp protease proteolytic subunit [Gemmataceae bacterium]